MNGTCKGSKEISGLTCCVKCYDMAADVPHVSWLSLLSTCLREISRGSISTYMRVVRLCKRSLSHWKGIYTKVLSPQDFTSDLQAVCGFEYCFQKTFTSNLCLFFPSSWLIGYLVAVYFGVCCSSSILRARHI
jgi:hypothetical protein